LKDQILSHLGFSEGDSLITWAYKDTSWQRFAALTPIVFGAAIEGDKIANVILDRAVDSLIIQINAVVKKLNISSEFPLVLAGGNLTHKDSILTTKLKSQLEKDIPNAKPILPILDLHVAAALLAKEALL